MNRNIFGCFKNVPVFVIGIVLITAIPIYSFAEEEGVFLDPQTGDYLVRFKSYTGLIEEGIFYPHTKVDPTVKSKLKLTDNSSIAYRYKVRNSKTSKQDLDHIIIYASHAYTTDQNTAILNSPTQVIPSGWDGTIAPYIGGSGHIVSWSYRTSNKSGPQGLPPGSGTAQFGFRSFDLAGVGMVRFAGRAPITMIPDEGPAMDSEAGKKLNELEVNDFVPRPAAVPLIPVPNPFDVAAVLTSIQKHVNQDLVGMKLIDPTFASQLDRLFQTAIAAAKGGNTVALKGDIKDLRRMLKSEHADVDKNDEDEGKNNDDAKEKNKFRLIDKLAAKVLDFDLKYIQKRLGHDS